MAKVTDLEKQNARQEEEIVDLKQQFSHTFEERSELMQDTRAQFTAFACTTETVTMSCPGGRQIFITSAIYAVYDAPYSTCSECCPPNPAYDCFEAVDESRPADWITLKTECDYQETCEFQNVGSGLDECSTASDYMQVFFNCLPDNETETAAFTALADAPTSQADYSRFDTIVFDYILSNFGGHYNADTSSFVCPWDGVYLVSVSIGSSASNEATIQMMKNEDILVEKAMNFMKSNVYSGKSWLIIARSLYPRNFNVPVVIFLKSFFIVHTILDVLLIPQKAKASIPPGTRIML